MEIGPCEFLLPLDFDYHQASEGTIGTIGTPSAVCHSIGPRYAMLDDDWRGFSPTSYGHASGSWCQTGGVRGCEVRQNIFLLVEEYDIALEKTSTSSDPAIQLNQNLGSTAK